jgi:transcriptional antiterminator NusG
MGVYVVQVHTGEEARACARLALHAKHAVERCYVPSVQLMQRFAGDWRKVQKPLVPGYVFAETADLEALRAALRGVPGFTRLLTSGDEVLPLTDDELAWLSAVGGTGTDCLPMSSGVIEGGVTRVLSGPLRGQEVRIKRIDRHKRLAFVEVQMFGRTLTVRMGLEITSKTAA